MLTMIIAFFMVTVLGMAVADADGVATPRLTLSDCPTWVPECKSNTPFPFFTPGPTPTGGDTFPTTVNHDALSINDPYAIGKQVVDIENRAEGLAVQAETVIQEGVSITIYHTLSYPVTQTITLSSVPASTPSESAASVSNSPYPSPSESQTTTPPGTTSSPPAASWTTSPTTSSGAETPGGSITGTETGTTSSISLSETPTNPIPTTPTASEVTSWTTTTTSLPTTLVTATSSPPSTGTGSHTSASASSHSSSSGSASASGSPSTTHPSASATASSGASACHVVKAGGAVLAGLGGMIALLA